MVALTADTKFEMAVAQIGAGIGIPQREVVRETRSRSRWLRSGNGGR